MVATIRPNTRASEEGRRVLAKMNMGSGQAPDEKKVMEYGFDAIFMGDKDSDSKK